MEAHVVAPRDEIIVQLRVDGISLFRGSLGPCSKVRLKSINF